MSMWNQKLKVLWRCRQRMDIMNDYRVKPLCVCMCVHVCAHAQRCPTVCHSLVCSPKGSFVHGIFQARILELPYPAPGDLSDPEIKCLSPALAGRFFTTEPPGKSKGDTLKQGGVLINSARSWRGLAIWVPGISCWDLRASRGTWERLLDFESLHSLTARNFLLTLLMAPVHRVQPFTPDLKWEVTLLGVFLTPENVWIAFITVMNYLHVSGTGTLHLQAAPLWWFCGPRGLYPPCVGR